MNTPVTETNINITELYADGGIQGSIQLLEMDDIQIDAVSLQHKVSHDKVVQSNQKHIELFFLLQGEHFYKSNDKQVLATTTGRMSFFHLPQIDGTLTFAPLQGKYSSVGIELSIAFLERILHGNLDLLGQFGKSLYLNRESAFSTNVVILPEMKKLLHELLVNNYSGALKKIFIETKITELLLLVITHSGESKYNHTSDFLTRADIDKLYYVRDLVSNNLQTPYSLRELSRLVGINEFKLKRGFKEVFNSTVFQYLYDERMELSQKLLNEENCSIADIAQMVGYKNPTHFTAAFKRKYSELPKDVRRQL